MNWIRLHGHLYVYRGLNVQMPIQFRGFRMHGLEQWCPVNGSGCILEVSFNEGFAVYCHLVDMRHNLLFMVAVYIYRHRLTPSLYYKNN